MIQKLLHNRYTRADETVIQLLRVSWLHYRYHIALYILLIIIAFFFLYPLQTFGTWGMGVFIGLLVIAFLGLARAALLRSLNLFIITDQRIIDIDQRSLFHRSVSECQLANIRDVRYNVKGVLSTLFRVGTVAVYIERGTGHIELNDVHDPGHVKEILEEARKNADAAPPMLHDDL